MINIFVILISKNPKYIFLFIYCLFGVKCLISNNLQVSNVSITEQNAILHSCKIQFNLSWENSWRTSTGAMNWDAAWVFVKYKKGINSEWKHATLSTNSTDHNAATGSIINAVSDGKGIFIYREYNGSGNNYFNGIKLNWNYGIEGVNENDTVQIKVIGIEMVFIPQGSFFAGDNNSSSACLIQGSNDNDPWHIGSENEINVTNNLGSGTGVGTTNAEYFYQSANLEFEDNTGTSFTIPVEFPKGFSAFYCMKYEISMGQYTDFLNLLSRNQQNTRTKTDVSTDYIPNYYVMTNTNYVSSGNTITCSINNNGTVAPIKFSTSTPERACNYISWSDIAALLDWSGLRPMTELEYEKACRGTLSANVGEYAWGNTQLYSSPFTIINNGANNENISNMGLSIGNALYGNTSSSTYRPFRCGIFSASTFNNSRRESGSSYYGIMELSGNVFERIISVGNPNGRVFTSINGDGLLDINGESDVPNWPGIDASGSGFRGGSWNVDNAFLQISNRANVAYGSIARTNDSGGRGVRQSP